MTSITVICSFIDFNDPNLTESCNGQNGCNGPYGNNGCNDCNGHNGCDGCNGYNGFLDNLDLSERPGVLT